MSNTSSAIWASDATWLGFQHLMNYQDAFFPNFSQAAIIGLIHLNRTLIKFKITSINNVAFFCFDANANRIWNGVRCFKKLTVDQNQFLYAGQSHGNFKFLRFRMTVDT